MTVSTYKGYCACHSMPALTRVTRVRGMRGDFDRLEFHDGNTKSEQHHGWYDRDNGKWPVHPFCRKRWLPQLVETLSRLRHPLT